MIDPRDPKNIAPQDCDDDPFHGLQKEVLARGGGSVFFGGDVFLGGVVWATAGDTLSCLTAVWAAGFRHHFVVAFEDIYHLFGTWAGGGDFVPEFQGFCLHGAPFFVWDGGEFHFRGFRPQFCLACPVSVLAVVVGAVHAELEESLKVWWDGFP